MINRLFSITFLLLVLLGIPVGSWAETVGEPLEQLRQPEIEISVEGGTLRVLNAVGQKLYVYNVTGVLVKTCVIDSPDKRIDLALGRGCYIVKVGTFARKIYLR
ncbi:T9SS C-terminal target domain-containing protein [Prevotella sp. A2931]|uniref:T9SS C-terminal target domain-containing protein n=1 Tax=Prevotella illustrans TaxID=2800387 RepID=A0ABS3M3L8_9BACT|nr:MULTISPECIES: DUF6383 domain-containing protein [Prevotella]MBO1362760.1 T9SS C-terminal target domain-containing protein [Prevotella illustrans]PTL25753.1 hypothetical protein C3V39_00875 [Prevotella sp. oral taxon 820]